MSEQQNIAMRPISARRTLHRSHDVFFVIFWFVVFIGGCSPPDPPAPKNKDTATSLPKMPEPPPRKVEFIAFTAKWCAECKELPHLIKQLQKDFPSVSMRDIDVDPSENRKICADFNVDALPYMFVVIDGSEVARLRGNWPYDHVATFLRDALKQNGIAGR